MEFSQRKTKNTSPAPILPPSLAKFPGKLLQVQNIFSGCPGVAIKGLTADAAMHKNHPPPDFDEEMES
jgi:hypothetical protein